MSKFKQLINPHSHTDHSLDGAATVEQIVKRNKELGAPYVSVTEHGNMNSAMRAYSAAHKAGIKPILGIEAYLVNPFHEEYVEIYKKAHANGLVKTRAKVPEKVEKELENKAMGQYLHITVHFKDEWAYNYFCKLSPKMWGRSIKRWDEEKAMVTLEELEGAKGHITITSSCMKGPVMNFLLPSRDGIIPASPEKAEFMYNKIRDIAGKENFFVEIFPHTVTHSWKKPEFNYATKQIVAPGEFIPNECTCFAPDGDLQRPLNRFVLDLAKKNGDKAIISLDSHFATENQKLIQNCRLGNGTEQWRFHESLHIFSTEEAAVRLKATLGLDDRDIEEMVDNSYAFASHFDNFKIATNETRWVLEDTSDQFMGKLKATIDKYGRMDYSNKDMMDRLQEEIRVLAHNGKINLLSYFDMVEDIASFCKKNNVLINVRGSAGGSLLLYLIGVSSFNPLKHNLSFERFLTEGRIKSNSLPDADIDVSDQEKVFDYLKAKHGDKFCRISTDVLLRIKSCLKDVERSELGYVRKETEDLCKKLPSTPQGVEDKDFVFGYIDSNGVKHLGLFDTNEALKKYAKDNKKLWETISEMLGIQRGKGSHACGIILADKPVEEYCPTIRMNGERVTGFSPKSIEAAGLIKLDILGLNTLRDIQNCIISIKERLGKDIDPWNLPYDKKVFKEFSEGNTETVFQFDTNVVRPYLIKIKPQSIEDLSAITALCRPGTLDAPSGDGRTLAQLFVDRKQGEVISYVHKDLEPIFKATAGIALYQEQTLQVFRDIGGFTYEEAENVRRAIGKKEEKTLAEATNRLKIACLKRNWSEDQVNLVMAQVMASSNYAFNKSHSISYSYVAYACMYLKVNYKLDWWKAALSNSSKDEMASKFWRHVQDFTMHPDINKSNETYTIVGDQIISPISILKGVGEKAYLQLIKHAPYKDLEQFVNIHLSKRSTGDRSAVTTGTAKKLIAGGVLDSLYDKEYSIEQKLEIFEALKAKAKGEYPKPIAKEYAEFIGITDLGRYMVKKQLISVYSKDLRPLMLPNRGGKIVVGDDGGVRAYKMSLSKDANGDDTHLFILDGNQIEWMKEKIAKEPLPEGETRYWGAVAYVIEEKAFPYRGKTKQATKLVLDVNGFFSEEMLWPAMDKDEADMGFKGLPCLVIYKEYRDKFVLNKLQKLLKEEDLDSYNMV